MNEQETKDSGRTREELEEALANAERPNLQAEVDHRVEKMEQLVDIQDAMRERIANGLARNGKSIRRNAPCPCGSGRKLKKCCLSKMKAAIAEKINPQPTTTPEEPTTDENHN